LDKEWRKFAAPSPEKADEENDGGKEIEYLEKDQNDLDIIRPLWDKAQCAPHHGF